MANNKDYDLDASLGDQNTFQGQAKANMEDRETKSLGDQVTFGGDDDHGDFDDDGMEIVDLAARYKIEKTLGKGGMGEVLLATDTRLGRKVAIKRILGDAARSRTAVSRFLTEAQSIAALNHPNIVQIYDYGRAQDGPFLIMEYVDGSSLLDRCRDRALPLEEAVELACQLCDGLGRAHDAGIIHRDIKPANVLLTADGVPKLTDFGLAKAESSDTGMTMAGAVLGTLDFMPPEQRRAATETDARSDLWSLAATLYQMVTGESPKVIRIKKVPSQLQDVLDKALEDSKEERYQTAKELRAAFRDCLKALQRQVSQVAADLGTGECPSCHSVNESHRKFCRECGDPLRCKCFKCEHEIPVWDKVCPECGGKQVELFASRLQEIQAQREHADRKKDQHHYQEAIVLAQSIAAIDDRRLNQHQSWAVEFIEATKTEWDRQKEIATQRFTEAKKHRQAFDYQAAIHAVESIPEPLRSSQIKEYLRTITTEREESTALIDTIKSRISERAINGLLPLVEKAVLLRGNRDDLRKLQEQLRERELKLDRERDEAFALARSLLEEGKAKEAYQAVQSIEVSRVIGDQALFREKLEQLIKAEKEIAAMVKAGNADGIFELHETASLYPKVSDYLRKNPKHLRLVKLQKDLIAILEKVSVAELMKLPSEALESLPENIRIKVPFTNSIGMKLRLIPAGKFTMGEGSDAHPVTLTKPFYLGIYEVTQEEYQRVMGSNPSYHNENGARKPVENVSWGDAVKFCRKLSELPEEKAAGRVYRLPTEAEWEYACRAGSKTAYSFGEDTSQLDEYAWFDKNANPWFGNTGGTRPVGFKKPNAWGLYDMHGNVWEWCSDWYGDYPTGAVSDPVGPREGSNRVIRGGGYSSDAGFCQSVFRYSYFPSSSYDYLGLRVALSSPSPPEKAVEFPHRSTVDELVLLLDSSDSEIASEAADALLRFGPKSKNALLKAVETAASNVACKAAVILCHIDLSNRSVVLKILNGRIPIDEDSLEGEQAFEAAILHSGIASIHIHCGDFASAILEYEASVRLNPNLQNGEWATLAELKDDLGDDSYLRAIDLYSKGQDLSDEGKHQAAKVAYCASIEASSDFPWSYNNLAWLLATCDDSRHRDGPNAVKLALKASELTLHRYHGILDTLAAAYAEVGNFQNAVKVEEKAVKVAPQHSRGEYEFNLNRYRAGQRWSEYKPLSDG